MYQTIEAAPSARRRLMWKMLAPLGGSSSPAYVQLDWHKVRDEDFIEPENGEGFTDYVGDFRARFRPQRLWKYAGVAGVRTDVFDDLKAWAGRAQPSHEGVAFHSDRGSYLGLLPPDVNFGTLDEYPDELLIAGRIGFKALHLAPVVFTPHSGRIWVPDSLEQYGRFAIKTLPERFPGMPLT